VRKAAPWYYQAFPGGRGEGVRKSAAFAIAFMILWAFVAAAAEVEYWGSAKSDKYHFPSCQWARKIHAENLIRWSTPEAARVAGYVPCKVCRPPVGSH
jgi:hypothetical protein